MVDQDIKNHIKQTKKRYPFLVCKNFFLHLCDNCNFSFLQKTATKAVVELPKGSKIEDGFKLNVILAEIHVPRMWVERHSDSQTHACMLTFYPEFESVSDVDPEIIILIDMSNSMKGKTEEDAKKVMPYSLVWISKHFGA